VLARSIGTGAAAATLAGIVFAFAPPRFFRLGQLHLTTVQWMPFCLAFLHKYFDSGRRRHLWWACVFFVAQVLTSAHGAGFCAVAIAALLAWRAAVGDPIVRSARIVDVAVPISVAVVMTVLIFLPYRAVQNEMGLRRSLEEATSFSPTLSSFLASPSHLHAALLFRLTGESIPHDARAFLFPGYLTLALAAVGAWAGLRQISAAFRRTETKPRKLRRRRK